MFLDDLEARESGNHNAQMEYAPAKPLKRVRAPTVDSISIHETRCIDLIRRTTSGKWIMPNDTFSAYDDAGNRYTVHVRRTLIETRGAGERRVVEGLRSYHLSDGGAVDRIDADSFAIAANGTALRLRPVGA